MRILRKLVLGGAFAAATLSAQDRAPRLDQIINGANYRVTSVERPTLGAGGWATIRGKFPIPNSCGSTIPVPGIPCTPQEYCQAQTVPLPTNLCGITVKKDGKELPILYVDKNQVNIVLPYETGDATFTAQANNLTSNELKAPIDTVGIGIFHDKRIGIALTPTYQLIGRDTPLDSTLADDNTERILAFFATGAGIPDQQLPIGTPAPLDRLIHTPTATAKIDGQELSPDNVRFSGLAPGYIALEQINIKIPTTLPDGTPLADGAHTIEFCVTQSSTTSCDKTDIITAAPGAKYTIGSIRGADNKDATVAGTIEDSNGTRDFKSSQLGTTYLAGVTLPAKITVDKASEKFGKFTSTIEAKNFEKMLIPWAEDPGVKKDYYPQAYSNLLNTFPDQSVDLLFHNGDQPINSPMMQHYHALSPNGVTKPTVFGRGPVPVYYGDIAERFKHALDNCQNPWNSEDATFTKTVTIDPEGAEQLFLKVQTTSAQLSTSRLTDAVITTYDNTRILTEGKGTILLAEGMLDAGICATYTHELGHWFGLKHGNDSKQVMWWTINPILPTIANMTHAPALETEWMRHHRIMGTNYKPAEHSWMQSTTPIDGATYKQTSVAEIPSSTFSMKALPNTEAPNETRSLVKQWKQQDGTVVKQYRVNNGWERYDVLDIEERVKQ